MGDRAAVEWAQEGHGEGLRRGLLNPERLLHGRRHLPRGPFLEGLRVDDYFLLARGPPRAPRPLAAH
eukprot:2195459-Lingulodinium_polyedra.AAC.1